MTVLESLLGCVRYCVVFCLEVLCVVVGSMMGFVKNFFGLC